MNGAGSITNQESWIDRSSVCVYGGYFAALVEIDRHRQRHSAVAGDGNILTAERSRDAVAGINYISVIVCIGDGGK